MFVVSFARQMRDETKIAENIAEFEVSTVNS